MIHHTFIFILLTVLTICLFYDFMFDLSYMVIYKFTFNNSTLYMNTCNYLLLCVFDLLDGTDYVVAR